MKIPEPTASVNDYLDEVDFVHGQFTNEAKSLIP